MFSNKLFEYGAFKNYADVKYQNFRLQVKNLNEEPYTNRLGFAFFFPRFDDQYTVLRNFGNKQATFLSNEYYAELESFSELCESNE